MCDWLSKETGGGWGWVLRFGFSAREFWNPQSSPPSKENKKGVRERLRALWFLTAPWWKVISTLIKAWIFPLIFLSLVQFCLLQRLKLCWPARSRIWGIPRLSRLLLQHSSHVSACSPALICACSFSSLLPFPRLSFCPRGKLLLHDTKVLHITVRKVSHAVCPEAILDLNVNYGKGKRDGLSRESLQKQRFHAVMEKRLKYIIIYKKKKRKWRGKRAEEEN